MNTSPLQPSWSRLSCARQIGIGRAALACALASLIFTGCRTDSRTALPAPPDRSHFLATEAFYQKQAETIQRTWDETNVRIAGDDVLLPETSTAGSALGVTTYSFYVYAYNPKHGAKTARQMLNSRELRIDVIGADAKFSFPQVPPESGTGASTISADAFISGNVVKLTLESKATTPLKPFTILAWFPVEHALAQAESSGKAEDYGQKAKAWYARKDIKVFYGDIGTRVQIVSDIEARASFGSEFPRHFFIGRVRLTNRSDRRALAVYTTSMRVPSLFYRKTTLADQLTPTASLAFNQEAERQFPANTDAATVADRIKHARDLSEWFLDRYPNPTGSVEPLDRSVLNPMLTRRALEIWAAKAAAIEANKDQTVTSSSTLLTLPECDAIITAALAHHLPANPANSRPEDLLKIAKTLVTEKKSTLIPDPVGSNSDHPDPRLAAAIDLAATTLEAAAQARLAALGSADAAREKAHLALVEIAALLDQAKIPLPTAPATKSTTTSATPSSLKPSAELRPLVARPGLLSWSGLWAQFPRLQSPEALTSLAARLDAALNESAFPGDTLRPRLRAAVALQLDLHRERLRHEAVAASLTRRAIPAPLFADAVDAQRNSIRLHVIGARIQSTPFGSPRPISVNPAGNPLVFSADPSLQRQLVEGGYMWRDYYRPMTFQAVLNALMFSHEQDPNTTGVQFLESLAKIAGGAVGLSSSFGGRDFPRGVSFFSSILVPELRTRLVDDLRKHITNLGEMSMDTVVIIPPNESFDRYVFFPRGAIYNFPDEFDPVTPGYIARIEGEELFVEAVPIDPGKTLRGGTVDALTLTGRALNEGEKSTQARLLDIAATQSQVRPVELANLSQRIEAIMAVATAAPEAERPAAIRRAELEVRRQIDAFNAYFGADSSGSLGYILQKFGLSGSNNPPSVLPTVSLHLPHHATSVEQTLLATDDLTPPEKLKLVAVADVAGGLTYAATSAKDLRYTLTAGQPTTDPATVQQRQVKFTVEDEAGNKATASQSVTLHPIVFTVIDTGASTIVTADKPQIKVPRESLYRVAVTTPTYDASLKDLTLEIAHAAATPDNAKISVKFSTPPAIATGTRLLRGEIELDASALVAPPEKDVTVDGKTTKVPQPVPSTLTLTFKQGATTLATQPLKLSIQPPAPAPAPVPAL